MGDTVGSKYYIKEEPEDSALFQQDEYLNEWPEANTNQVKVNELNREYEQDDTDVLDPPAMFIDPPSFEAPNNPDPINDSTVVKVEYFEDETDFRGISDQNFLAVDPSNLEYCCKTEGCSDEAVQSEFVPLLLPSGQSADRKPLTLRAVAGEGFWKTGCRSDESLQDEVDPLLLHPEQSDDRIPLMSMDVAKRICRQTEFREVDEPVTEPHVMSLKTRNKPDSKDGLAEVKMECFAIEEETDFRDILDQKFVFIDPSSLENCWKIVSFSDEALECEVDPLLIPSEQSSDREPFIPKGGADKVFWKTESPSEVFQPEEGDPLSLHPEHSGLTSLSATYAAPSGLSTVYVKHWPEYVIGDKCSTHNNALDMLPTRKCEAYSSQDGGVKIQMPAEVTVIHFNDTHMGEAGTIARHQHHMNTPTLREDLRLNELCGGLGTTGSGSSGLQSHGHSKANEKKRYACALCSYTCNWKNSVVLHMTKHTGVRKFCCTECSYETAHGGALKRHMSKHTGVKKFCCTECSYKTAYSECLQYHMTKHTGVKKFCCTECSFKTAHSGGFKYHMSKHTGVKKFCCTECSYMAAQRGQLESHMSKHTGEKKFCCTECSYKTAHRGSLRYHMTKHTGVKKFCCTECSYKAAHGGSLKYHMTKHTGVKKFCCSECSYMAAQRGQLKVHMSIHTGVKEFCCTECSYQTAHGGALKSHMKKHTGVKDFCCTECSYQTAHRGSLRYHMSKHNGLGMFFCTECDYKTEYGGDFKTHMLKHAEGKKFLALIAVL